MCDQGAALVSEVKPKQTQEKGLEAWACFFPQLFAYIIFKRLTANPDHSPENEPQAEQRSLLLKPSDWKAQDRTCLRLKKPLYVLDYIYLYKQYGKGRSRALERGVLMNSKDYAAFSLMFLPYRP